MFRHILVPTDFSKNHVNSLDIAVNLAEKYKSAVYLLHVIEIMPDLSIKEFETFYKKLEKKAQNQLEVLASGYNCKAYQIILSIKYGNRIQEILKFVKEYEIDLILMNSHKVKKNPVQNWGTISYKVAFLSEIPVMLVK